MQGIPIQPQQYMAMRHGKAGRPRRRNSAAPTSRNHEGMAQPSAESLVATAKPKSRPIAAMRSIPKGSGAASLLPPRG